MLTRRKSKPGTTDSPAKGPVAVVSHIGSAGRYFNLALLLSLIILGLAAAGVLFVQQQQRQQSLQQELAVTAEAVAARIAEAVATRQALLEGLATDSEIRQRMLREDLAGLDERERRLEQWLPGALRVRLLPKGWDRLDTGSQPPFSYAALDVSRRVERTGQPVPAEVHLLGTPQQHMALAAPVLSDPGGTVLGVLHVAFPFSLLEGALAKPDHLIGRIELQQMVKSVPAVVATVGEASGQPDGVVPIANTIWQVAYTAATPAFGNDTDLLIIAILGLAALLIMAVMLFQSRQFRRAMQADLESLFGLVEVLKQGSVGRVNPPRLEEFGHIFGLIRQIWHQAGAKSGEGQSPARGPASGSRLPGFDEIQEILPKGAPAARGASLELPPASIFRAYDIRGVVGQTLTEDGVYQLGRAIGSEAQDQGERTVIVARDGRHSGPAFSQALSDGLMASGCDVLDIGMVPTPLLYFATHFLGAQSGVMITGSHNPAEYNGLKIVIKGIALSGAQIIRLRQRIQKDELSHGQGALQERDLTPDYIQRILDDVQLSRPLKLVVDCGNGVAGLVAPPLFQALGCEVIPLYCEVDGDFPHHHPDPGQPENLVDLIQSVRDHQADLGVAFDGDGDRLGVVDGNGKVIWPDRILMLLARDILARQPGADVIYDVKSSRHLADEILACGGRPIMWKTGHSLIKAKMRETGALLAGEMSGHIFINERWYGFDDALYSCARLLEVLSMEPISVVDVFDQLPESVSTPELTLSFGEEGENFAMMEKLIARMDFADAKVVDIDGLRIEFEDGWGLVRPSNTTPALVFRFEADSTESLAGIQRSFRHWLLAVNPGLELPF